MTLEPLPPADNAAAPAAAEASDEAFPTAASEGAPADEPDCAASASAAELSPETSGDTAGNGAEKTPLAAALDATAADEAVPPQSAEAAPAAAPDPAEEAAAPRAAGAAPSASGADDDEAVDHDSALAEFWDYESLGDDDAPARGGGATDPRLTPKERKLFTMRLEGKVEAVVFASQKPLRPQEIVDVLADSTVTADDVQATLDQLVEFYEARNGGFRLHYLKRLGYQFQTAEAAGPVMERMFASRPRPISRASLETLAIIAYRQPVTRAEVEFIRGVDAGSIFKTLLERELIRCVGRKEIVGRPMLFGTSDQFLTVFNLSSIKDLPTLESFQPARDMVQSAMARIESQGDELVDVEEYIADSTRGGYEGGDPDLDSAADEAAADDPAAAEPLAAGAAQPAAPGLGGEPAAAAAADGALAAAEPAAGEGTLPPASPDEIGRRGGALAMDEQPGDNTDGTAADTEMAEPDGDRLPERSGELDH